VHLDELPFLRLRLCDDVSLWFDGASGSFYSPSECVVNEGTVVEMKGAHVFNTLGVLSDNMYTGCTTIDSNGYGPP
jgi:hypothetical protein